MTLNHPLKSLMEKAVFPVAQTDTYSFISAWFSRPRKKKMEDKGRWMSRKGGILYKKVGGFTLIKWNCTEFRNVYYSRTTTIGQSSSRWCFRKLNKGTSPVVRCLRINLPIQGAQVPFPVWEDSTCRGQLSPCIATTKPMI